MPKFAFTDTVTIYHLVRNGNTESMATSSAYSNINAVITPKSTQNTASSSGVSGSQLYDVFLFDTALTLKTGDKLVTAKGVTYFVANQPFLVDNSYLHFIQLDGRRVV